VLDCSRFGHDVTVLNPGSVGQSRVCSHRNRARNRRVPDCRIRCEPDQNTTPRSRRSGDMVVTGIV
jgi:hypothetical protein